MDADEHIQRQRRFYDTRQHEHLRPQADEAYARHLAECVVAELGLGPGDRVLEVGAGFGRFTFHLLPHVGSLVALDLSPVALAALAEERAARSIDADRCVTLPADLYALPETLQGERFDAVVGFFLLHHLPDIPRALAGLGGLLRPGGRMSFVEPNRRNPLFLAQVACCPDMTWQEEKGMFQLSRGRVLDAYRDAGLQPARVRSVGFFPPPLVNRSAGFRRLERWLEARSALAFIRPMLLLSASAPGAA